MRPAIHPEYRVARITCACGRVTATRSTQEELHVEICSHCHPFFTGRQKLVDTAGRVERFMTKYGMGEEAKEMAAEAAARAAESERQELPAEVREANLAAEKAAAEARAARLEEEAEVAVETPAEDSGEAAGEEAEEARAGTES